MSNGTKQYIQPNGGLDILCPCEIDNLNVKNALTFNPGCIADFTGADVIGLNTGPTASNTRLVYVNKGGSNAATSDGTELYPYFTISHALAQITDNSILKQYSVMIGPGDYSESIALKPNVNLVAQSALSVTLDGTIDITSDFADGQMNTCLLQDITFAGSCIFGIDFFAVSCLQSLVALAGCTLYCPLTVSGTNTQCIFVARDVSFVNTVTCVSGFTQMYNCLLAGGTLSLQAGAVGRDQQNFIFNTNGLNALSILAPGGGGNSSTFLFSSFCSALTLNGANVFVLATSNSIPTVANLSVLNSAALNRVNDANGVRYDPTTPADWAVPPSTVQEGLDDLAALSAGVSSGNFAPVSANLVSITSVDFGRMYWQKTDSIVSVNYSFRLTLPAIPQANCRFSASLPVAPGANFADASLIGGSMSIACDDGSLNPSGSNSSYAWVMARAGSPDVEFRFDAGIGATSSSIMLSGAFSYLIV